LGVGPIAGEAFDTGPGCEFTVNNIGNTDLVVSALNFSNVSGSLLDWDTGSVTLPVTIAPGASAPLGFAYYTPQSTVAPGTIEVIQVTFVSNAISGLQSYQIQGTAVDLPTGIILSGYLLPIGAVQMPSLNLGTLVPGQVVSFEVVVHNPDSTLTNPPVTIAATALTAKGYAVTPASISANPESGGSFTVTLTVPGTAAGLQDDVAALTIKTNTLSGTTCTFEVFYSVALIVPAFTLVGDQEATLVAFYPDPQTPPLSNAVATLNAFTPALATEDAVSFSRQYYVDQPHLNKILNRIWLLYERYGAFTLECTASAVNPKNAASSSDTLTGDAATDGLLQIGCLDVQITGSCLNIAYSMAANSGILSIAGMLMKLDEEGEVIENT
jgi:hypothetical protein